MILYMQHWGIFLCLCQFLLIVSRAYFLLRQLVSMFKYSVLYLVLFCFIASFVLAGVLCFLTVA